MFKNYIDTKNIIGRNILIIETSENNIFEPYDCELREVNI